MKVSVLTVTYGNRWKFLSQVADAVLGDNHVVEWIVVDNASLQAIELDALSKQDSRVKILRLDKNIGSAGGYAKALDQVRESEVDYVLLLDDDIVPEKDFIELYVENYKHIGDPKAVLCGNRVDIPGNEEYFSHNRIEQPSIRGTFFEVFSWKKIKRFFQIANRGLADAKTVQWREWVPSEGFAYGGTFLPIEAVRNAPLPDKDLVLYYDDIEYSWGVLKSGFNSYLCRKPELRDVDMSFGEQSQAVGLCDPKSASFKAYYFLRNRVRVSVRNTQQSQIALFINILIWTFGLYILGLVRHGFSYKLLKRLKLLTQAVYAGYVYSAGVPSEIRLPG